MSFHNDLNSKGIASNISSCRIRFELEFKRPFVQSRSDADPWVTQTDNGKQSLSVRIERGFEDREPRKPKVRYSGVCGPATVSLLRAEFAGDSAQKSQIHPLLTVSFVVPRRCRAQPGRPRDREREAFRLKRRTGRSSSRSGPFSAFGKVNTRRSLSNRPADESIGSSFQHSHHAGVSRIVILSVPGRETSLAAAFFCTSRARA